MLSFIIHLERLTCAITPLMVDARGVAITSSYDNVNRLIGQLFPNGSRITLAYDSVGNRTLMQDLTGTTAWTYDPLDRVTTCMNGAGKSVQYAYDNDNRRDLLIDPDGGHSYPTYDKANRLATMVNPTEEMTTWQYDANSRVVQVIQANGVTASTAYDAIDRVLSLQNIGPDASLVSSFSYTYDNLNNRQSVVEVDGSQVAWTYDSTYQLLSETRNGTLGWSDLTLAEWSAMTLAQWSSMTLESSGVSYATTYTYDPAGNRQTRSDATSGLTTYGYDAANQLVTAVASTGTTTYSYDAAGNRTLRVQPAVGTTTYSWDYQNRLLGMIDPVTGVSTNVYNGVGQRMETQNSGGTTMFVFDFDNLLLETDGGGTTQVYYTLSTTMAGQFGEVISQRFPHGTPSAYTEFYTFDALGSTTNLADEAGAVDDQYVYTAFGTLVSLPQPTQNRRTYVGKFGYQDDFGSGVYYCTARWYEADTGRWLSQDPIWPLTGTNPYNYVGSGPVNLTDPSGLSPPLGPPLPSGNYQPYHFVANDDGSGEFVPGPDPSGSDTFYKDPSGTPVWSSPANGQSIIQPAIGGNVVTVGPAVDPSFLQQWKTGGRDIAPDNRPVPAAVQDIIASDKRAEAHPIRQPCPTWKEGGKWKIKNIYANNVSHWGELMRAYDPKANQSNNPFVRLFEAAAWLKFDLRGDAILDGKLCCCNGTTLSVHVDIDFKYVVTQRLYTRAWGVFVLGAGLNPVTFAARSLAGLHTLFTFLLEYGDFLEMIMSADKVTGDLNKMYTVAKGIGYKLEVSPSSICLLGLLGNASISLKASVFGDKLRGTSIPPEYSDKRDNEAHVPFINIPIPDQPML